MRLLIITHTFPPSTHSNAKRPYYLAKGFLDRGWKVDVITSRIGMRDGLGEVLDHGGGEVTRTIDPVWRLQHTLSGHRRLARAVGIAANGLLWPDFCALWAKSVFRRLRKVKHNYDRILAFVFPPSVLLAGGYEGLVDRRWIFDFQESVSPQFARHPRKSPLQRLLTRRLENLERSTLHKAGRVVFTADSNRQAYLAAGLVPKAGAEHVPYFYDDAAFVESGTVDPLFEIGYYGNFDLGGARNPATFFAAMSIFLERHPEARVRTRFTFHGTWLGAHTGLLERSGLADIASINPPVPYFEYLQKLKSSPVLLLLVSEVHNLFMPSKIVDYFGARRPILAFVPGGSEMHDVLVKAGMGDYLCGETDAEAGALAIEKLWQDYLNGSLRVDSTMTEQWSSEVQIPRYIRILESAALGV